MRKRNINILPDGYETVVSGTVRRSDIVWDTSIGDWCGAWYNNSTRLDVEKMSSCSKAKRSRTRQNTITMY